MVPFVINVPLSSILTETMQLTNTYAIWKPSGRIGTGGGTFTADITLHIPEHEILIRPGLAESLKFAWIQWLSILIIVGWIAEVVRQFMFHHQVVETRITTQHFDQLKKQ